MKIFSILIVFTTLLLTSPEQAGAQNRYTDSLYSLLKQGKISDEEKVRIQSHLSDIVRFYDTKEALQLTEAAVALANKLKDPISQTYAYESRSAVYLRMQESEKAHRDTDSCLMFAEKSKDPIALSWAWYRKGRELDYENASKEAVSAQLKALNYIKGRGQWKEEASIYYALFGIFAGWEDIVNSGKYAHLALDAAIKSGNPNNICESWQAVATAAHDHFEKGGEKDRQLLDSSLNAYRQSINTFLQNEQYMNMFQLITIPCINMADAYSRHFPPSKTTSDSLRHYATLAFNYATKGKDKRLQAASFGLMNEDAKRNGDYELAETYLMQALTLFDIPNEAAVDYDIRSNVYHDLAELAERKKDYAKALQFQKLFIEDYKKVFDAEQNNTAKKLEAQYQAKEQEQEIKFLKEKESLHRMQKYLYAGIGLALLTVLIFMFRSYHFKIRYSMQREELLKKDKEEADLLAQLKIEENLALEAEKRNAELHAQLQEEQLKLKAEETARLQTEQQVILAQKEILQKEVIAGRLHVEQKNKILKGVKEHLSQHKNPLHRDSELSKLLKQEKHIDNEFEEVAADLTETHPAFYKTLREKSDNKLTDLDLKYCSYILLKRNNSDIARLLSVEPKSVRMTKYRLKQKLGLGKEEDLDLFISSLV
ncbi:hypothetical protein HHL16_15835 [Pseudoflavitalea sp. G-6-1-2]|uniref:hypothetical protein n=1 Tax=Pseudoflavitalea sp. G-6-1-2 TaxID=2728841 RepID=UPI001469AE3E|nr:hypothetical protein [Pseudoflavitalea sp. G-6-1-2]NML22354.1 hypothetical protein [Pseudoflavitalea sp. G-6-1-2]